MKEKNKEIFQEVEAEIDSALKDSKGIIAHQRRLAFVISLGTVCLLEEYLDRKADILSGGYKQRFMIARCLMHNLNIYAKNFRLNRFF